MNTLIINNTDGEVLREHIYTKEHTEFDVDKDTENKINKKFSETKDNCITSLKINKVNEEEKVTFKTDYYVGVDWLIENELALVVQPKIEHVNFLQMFMTCLKCADVRHHLNNTRRNNKIYDILCDKPPIEINVDEFEVTPLLIIHYIHVLQDIAKRGLQKNYIRVEENLSSKIKGKIMMAQHLKKNAMHGRDDRVFCNYQEYSVNNKVNQLLKKAFVFAKKYCATSLKNTTIDKDLSACMGFVDSAFSHVDEVHDAQSLRKRFTINKLYKSYDEAVQLARLILQRFSYTIQETQKNTKEKTPPFYINMPLLFELYVLGKLQEQYGTNIQYQAEGNYGEVDFLKIDEQIILDTKYKDFDKNNKDYKIEDIRQLAGYARDTKILNKFKNMDRDAQKNFVAPCLIIHPTKQKNGIENFEKEPLLELAEKDPIKQFTKFYRIGVQLPSLPV